MASQHHENLGKIINKRGPRTAHPEVLRRVRSSWGPKPGKACRPASNTTTPGSLTNPLKLAEPANTPPPQAVRVVRRREKGWQSTRQSRSLFLTMKLWWKSTNTPGPTTPPALSDPNMIHCIMKIITYQFSLIKANILCVTIKESVSLDPLAIKSDSKKNKAIKQSSSIIIFIFWLLAFFE